MNTDITKRLLQIKELCRSASEHVANTHAIVRGGVNRGGRTMVDKSIMVTPEEHAAWAEAVASLRDLHPGDGRFLSVSHFVRHSVNTALADHIRDTVPQPKGKK